MEKILNVLIQSNEKLWRHVGNIIKLKYCDKH